MPGKLLSKALIFPPLSIIALLRMQKNGIYSNTGSVLGEWKEAGRELLLISLETDMFVPEPRVVPLLKSNSKLEQKPQPGAASFVSPFLGEGKAVYRPRRVSDGTVAKPYRAPQECRDLLCPRLSGKGSWDPHAGGVGRDLLSWSEQEERTHCPMTSARGWCLAQKEEEERKVNSSSI